MQLSSLLEAIVPYHDIIGSLKLLLYEMGDLDTRFCDQMEVETKETMVCEVFFGGVVIRLHGEERVWGAGKQR